MKIQQVQGCQLYHNHGAVGLVSDHGIDDRNSCDAVGVHGVLYLYCRGPPLSTSLASQSLLPSSPSLPLFFGGAGLRDYTKHMVQLCIIHHSYNTGLKCTEQVTGILDGDPVLC